MVRRFVTRGVSMTLFSDLAGGDTQIFTIAPSTIEQEQVELLNERVVGLRESLDNLIDRLVIGYPDGTMPIFFQAGTKSRHVRSLATSVCRDDKRSLFPVEIGLWNSLKTRLCPAT